MDFSYLFLVVFLLPYCIGQDAASLSVTVMPREETQTFKLGEGKVLTCTASSPDAVLNWYGDGDSLITTTDPSARVLIDRSTGNNAVRLRFTKVEEQDAGRYVCKAVLGNLNDQKAIVVEVMVPLQINSKSEQQGNFGEDGKIICDVTGKPVPSLTWKFNNGTVITNSDKYIISAKELTIKQLTMADNQTYICYIIVDATGDERVFKIDFFVVKKPVMSLLPTFSPANPKVGDTVEIRCLAEGIPAPEYSFYRNDVQVSEDKVNKQNGILTLTNVQREDEATYRCEAVNRGGKDEKSNTLDIKIPPVITEINDVPDASEGNSVKLRCTAEGDPEPSVTWKKDGTQTSYLDTGARGSDPYITTEKGENLMNAITKTQTQILNFDRIRPEDAGTYTCTAFNLVGTVNRTAKIAVQYKPHFNTDFKVKEFWGWTGHTANLTCQASANPAATIDWFQPNTESPDNRLLDTGIDNSAPYIITSLVSWPEYHLTSRSLLISLTSADNDQYYKDYVCKASNVLGVNYQIVTLKKANVPGIPVIKVIETLSTSVKLAIEKPSENGGVDVSGYKYKFILNGQATKEQDINLEGDSTPLDVKNLQAGSKYSLEVYAKNAVGLGTPKVILVETKETSRPEKLNIESPPQGDAPNAYTVQWSEPVNGGSPIQKFIIEYRKCEIIDITKDAKDWTLKNFLDDQYTTQTVLGPSHLSYTITGLDSDSYYHVRVYAVNEIGTSEPEAKYIKTSSQAKTISGAGSASLSSGTVIGIIIGIILFLAIAVLILFLVIKKKPELVHSLRGRFSGKDGEEERGKKEDGKDAAEAEKLIKKEDTVKVESELGESKNDVIEEHPEEFEPESKPQPQAEAQKSPTTGAEKVEELKTPSATTEIKITPETPEKPENPAA